MMARPSLLQVANDPSHDDDLYYYRAAILAAYAGRKDLNTGQITRLIANELRDQANQLADAQQTIAVLEVKLMEAINASMEVLK